MQLGVPVYGVSGQDLAYQKELAERIRLPYEVLSDPDLVLAQALSLPTFVFGGVRLLKRLTLVVEAGRIVKVFYPVFPPDRDAGQVLGWLAERLVETKRATE